MKKIKYDKKLLTISGGERQVSDRARQITKDIEADIKALPSDPASLVITEYDVIERHIRRLLEEFRPLHKLTQKQLDAAIRKARGKHAVEALIDDVQGWQTYRLDDGTLLRVYRYTGTVVKL